MKAYKFVLVAIMVAVSGSAYAGSRGIEDVLSMVLNEVGTYDVTCKNGSTQEATLNDLQYGSVCNGSNQQMNANIEALFAQPNGNYFVLCKNKTWETATANGIQNGQVCTTSQTASICATNDASYVYYQITAPANAIVECYYNGSLFYNPATYNTSTGRWSCSPWTKGNPDYEISMVVNGIPYYTSEYVALANYCQ